MAGSLDWLRSRNVSAAPARASAGPRCIRLTPSKMKLRPNPKTSPRTTGRLVRAATHETAPVIAMTSQNTPVTSPEAQIIAGLTMLACVTATVAIAFMG